MADARRESAHAPSETTQNTAQEHTKGDRTTGGRGWHGDPEGHAAAGRKGGKKVSGDREHMASIGRKGGESVSQNRQHMADIGRKGGQARTERGDEKKTA